VFPSALAIEGIPPEQLSSISVAKECHRGGSQAKPVLRGAWTGWGSTDQAANPMWFSPPPAREGDLALALAKRATVGVAELGRCNVVASSPPST